MCKIKQQTLTTQPYLQQITYVPFVAFQKKFT
jgi:hypothetical protein